VRVKEKGTKKKDHGPAFMGVPFLPNAPRQPPLFPAGRIHLFFSPSTLQAVPGFCLPPFLVARLVSLQPGSTFDLPVLPADGIPGHSELDGSPHKRREDHPDRN